MFRNGGRVAYTKVVFLNLSRHFRGALFSFLTNCKYLIIVVFNRNVFIKEKAMMFTISNNLSAIMAYGKKIAVHANNIANMNSEGFEKSRAVVTQSPDQTVKINREDAEPLIRPVLEKDPNQKIQNYSNRVDLAEEIVNIETTQTGYDANLAVIKTADELTGSLLDILG
jgi:flagellar basal-body rod protein FlgC